MYRRFFASLLSLSVLLLSFNRVRAQERALLFSRNVSPQMQQAVQLLRDTKNRQNEAHHLTWETPYFVRIAPREKILTANNDLIGDSATKEGDVALGTRPFVFVTSPESLYGRSLVDIYMGIGYEAEDILRWQRNQDMVAILFRYPQKISAACEVKDGCLPIDWKHKVYVPYWDNVFSLFHHLAQEASVEPGRVGEFAPDQLFFRSTEEKVFALKCSKHPNAKLKQQSYITLKVRGGNNWRYRQLLENKLSLFEHFRGTGRTQDEVSDPNGEADGLVEFVGPNCKLKDMAEIAIIDLGRLEVRESYSSH